MVSVPCRGIVLSDKSYNALKNSEIFKFPSPVGE